MGTESGHGGKSAPPRHPLRSPRSLPANVPAMPPRTDATGLNRRLRGLLPDRATSTRAERPRYSRLDMRVIRGIRNGYEILSLPFLTVFMFHDRQFHEAYRLTWRRKFRLALQMHRNNRRIETGTSNRAHMAMAAKIFSISPSVKGAIVEAGCWKGGTTANLSLIADIVDRDLIVYDSFEGLPAPADGDRWANPMGEGAFKGELEEVQDNVRRHGVVERCTFRKGWFSDTMGDHTEPIVFAFLDVDHQASMHQCIVALWPHLVDRGYVFVDEYVRLDYCALFFSERFWRTYFDRPPPGLMGAGTGAAVGQHFIGPYRSMPPIQEPRSVGWTRKDFYAEWDYVAPDVPDSPMPGGGKGASHGPDGWTTTTVPQDAHANRKFAEILEASEEAREKLHRKLTETEEGRELLAAKLAAKARAEAEQSAAQASSGM